MWFIIKILKYIYQKILNKTVSINTKQSTFKLFLLQVIELNLGCWIYLIYITAIHTTLSAAVLFFAYLRALLYIIPLMLIIGCFRLLSIFYKSRKNQMSDNKFYKYCLSCTKRTCVLILPIFFMGMLLLDVLVTGYYHYATISTLLWLKIVGLTFYIVCLWSIFQSYNKWNVLALIFLAVLIIGLIHFNSDLKKIYQHSQYIENITYPCPIALY